MTTSAFAKYETKHYPHRYRCALLLDSIAGGVPSDKKVAEGWIKTKLATTDELLQAQVAEVAIERGVPMDEAAAIVAEQSINGFKRDEHGLYIEGRQVKAMIKEAASIARAADRLPARWGTTNKGVLGYVTEHIFVVEDRIPLGVNEPTGIEQRFIHKMTARGHVSAIQVEEYVSDAKVSFTVESDHEFSDNEWAAIWLTAERNGLGASRSQGYGRFTVVEWTHIK